MTIVRCRLGLFEKASPVAQQIQSFRLSNGLTVITEAMPWLESAAFAFLVPSGCVFDRSDRGGLASFTCEMIQRGCGERNSREFIDALENLGADCSASVSIGHTSFGGAMPAAKLPAVLEIYADLLLRPHFPEDQLEDARQVCLQEVRGIEDELAQKTMQELRRRYYGDPWGRSNHGTEASVEAITHADLLEHFTSYYRPEETILSIAGKIDPPRLIAEIERLFATWQSGKKPKITETAPERGYLHLPHDSGETHLGVAFEGVPYSHADYFEQRGAIGVLSDGMSSRLFTEVREKRGLVYTVYASCQSLLDRGAVFAYAGTTSDKAQETLDVMLAELAKLREGVTDEELARLKAHMKTSIIMQQESSRSRAGSMAGDWYHLGRVRPMEELEAILNRLSASSINRYLSQCAPPRFTIASLGQDPVEISNAVS